MDIHFRFYSLQPGYEAFKQRVHDTAATTAIHVVKVEATHSLVKSVWSGLCLSDGHVTSSTSQSD